MTCMTWHNVPESTIVEWVRVVDGYAPGDVLKISTPTGVITVEPGEWLIKRANGEIYTAREKRK